MSSVTRFKQRKRSIINRHDKADNVKAFTQVLTTLVPLTALWYIVGLVGGVTYWLTAGVTILMSFFVLRVFTLMHDCGHGSLFRTAWLNNAFGFLFGVVTGMPQYVWSRHHAYHHSTNGDWEKYRGPLNILSVDEYAAITGKQQRMYRWTRSIWLAPVGGFVYLILNPRFTWLKGSIGLVRHLIRNKIARPGISIKASAAQFEARYWESATEYRHMSWNNVVLLVAWIAMSWAIGAALFFTVYIISVSLAGAAGIVLFTVEHNFEHSYASDTKDWDYDTAAIHGTSFLILPRWLNWFIANNSYHHVHHLSAKIPNYGLMKCHEENKELFSDVTRVKLSEIYRAVTYILWDRHAARLISVAEYQQQGK